MKTNAYLCSFASPDLDLSVKRFNSQALDLNFYQNIKIFRTTDLSKKLNERISNLLKQGGKHRYYGYCVWRYEVVASYLNSLPENSILHYCDIGCHFNKNGIERLKDYILMTKKNNMTVFEYGEPPNEIKKFNYHFQKYMEYEFTKGDIIKYFGLNFDSKIINSPQIWVGTFFMKKCDFVFKFLQDWEKANKHNELMDDSKSKTENHEKFSGPRGDQSVFSIICKQNKVYSISASECEWAEFEGGRRWDHLKNYPLLAKRDKKYNILKRFFNRQKKSLKRFLKKFQ